MLAVWSVRRGWPRLWLAGGLLAIAGANTVYWNRVYDANLEHMVNVRLAAAAWLPNAFANSETCAASDIGAVRYFSQRPIVDLGGLIDLDLGAWFLRGEFDRYLLEHGVTCLVMPGQIGTSEDSSFDLAGEMGLTHSPLLTLQPLAQFHIARDRWLLGYLPVVNYQARVTLFRVQPSRAAP